jgi:hypothetical protein
MTRRVLSTRLLTVIAVALTPMACAPRLRPLPGAPVAARLPRAELPAGHRRIVFTWELRDPDFHVRGEGVARLAPPDSARLDFFVAGGFGGGRAVRSGQSVRAPGGPFVRRLIPSAPLLWAALGRLALPPLPDTAVRVDDGVIRADVGAPPAWRITFRGDTLSRLDRVSGDRVVEWVERPALDRVRYRHEAARRDLTLTLLRDVEEASPFDATIWNP